MPMYHFKNIGPDKRSFSVECRDGKEAARVVKREGRLKGRDIGLVMDRDITRGEVFVGIHCVGTYEVEQTN